VTAPAPLLLDLRSDTVTRPTAAMRRAMADAEVGDDVLQDDPTTKRFEAAVAERLGKEAALFFPSGTMANQAAIWVLTTPGTEIYVDAESHVVHSEVAGSAALAGVQVRPVKGAGRVMTAADVEAHMRLPTADSADASLVCFENTHNGAGGVVSSREAVAALQAVARSYQLPMHLDGARLWNASAASGTSMADYAACADTVMVSFSKGLGAPIGACLAGSREQIARARKVRKRFGGGMRQSGVITAAAHHALEHHVERLPEDHEAARYLGQLVDGIGGATIVPPDSNILMIDLPRPVAADVAARAASHGIRLSVWTSSRVRAVTHLDAPIGKVAAAAPLIVRAIGEALGE
jgi:threonine aldolase